MEKNDIYNIAIADDHWQMRDAIRQALELFGYRVIIEAENGTKLISQINDACMPEICVVDLNMPLLNGLETTQILKKKWPSVKVLILSMTENVWVRREAKAAGADAFLFKLEPLEKLRALLKYLEK